VGTGVLAGAPGAGLPESAADGGTGLRLVDGVLHVDAMPLPAIAEAAGTPCYVYSAGVVRRQYRRLAATFTSVPHRIHYSVKANSNLALLRLLRDEGAGVDVVSGGELYRAREAGTAPHPTPRPRPLPRHETTAVARDWSWP